MEQDGFVLVTNRRRHRKRRQLQSIPFGKSIPTGDLSQVPVEKIDEIIEEAVAKLRFSSFCDQVKLYLKLALGEHRHLSCIVAVGIGNFSERRFNGVYQVALLIILMEHFNCNRCLFREPHSTKSENEWLQSRGVQVEECSDLLGEIFVNGGNCDDLCLFYMPHCGHALYNNVLYSHRQLSLLKQLIIFGNSLKDLPISKYHSHELNAICAYRACCEAIQMPSLSDAPFAFNDTSIHFLHPSQTVAPDISDCTPKYDFYASEIIL